MYRTTRFWLHQRWIVDSSHEDFPEAFAKRSIPPSSWHTRNDLFCSLRELEILQYPTICNEQCYTLHRPFLFPSFFRPILPSIIHGIQLRNCSPDRSHYRSYSRIDILALLLFLLFTKHSTDCFVDRLFARPRCKSRFHRLLCAIFLQQIFDTSIFHPFDIFSENENTASNITLDLRKLIENMCFQFFNPI